MHGWGHGLCKSCACTMYRHHETHAWDLTSFGISKSWADGKRKEGVLGNYRSKMSLGNLRFSVGVFKLG